MHHHNQLVKVEQVARILCVSKSHVWAQVNNNPDFAEAVQTFSKADTMETFSRRCLHRIKGHKPQLT